MATWIPSLKLAAATAVLGAGQACIAAKGIQDKSNEEVSKDAVFGAVVGVAASALLARLQVSYYIPLASTAALLFFRTLEEETAHAPKVKAGVSLGVSGVVLFVGTAAAVSK